MYEIRSEPGKPLQAWSSVRLPFEPRSWLKEFRDDLRAAIEQLPAGPEGIVRATYTSESTDLCDVENVLLYNVGTAAFRRLATNGIAFERVFGAPSPAAARADYAHHYSYDPAPRAGFVYWRKVSTLADWRTAVHPSDINSLSRLWWRLKNDVGYSPAELRGAYFSLEVRVHCPSSVGINLAGRMKPMFDGVICAFHCDPDVTSDVAERIGAVLEINREAIVQALSDSQRAALGRRKLVWPYRANVQWNPADDKCVAGEILRFDSADWLLAGSLCEVTPIRCAVDDGDSL